MREMRRLAHAVKTACLRVNRAASRYHTALSERSDALRAFVEDVWTAPRLHAAILAEKSAMETLNNSRREKAAAILAWQEASRKEDQRLSERRTRLKTLSESERIGELTTRELWKLISPRKNGEYYRNSVAAGLGWLPVWTKDYEQVWRPAEDLVRAELSRRHAAQKAAWMSRQTATPTQ